MKKSLYCLAVMVAAALTVCAACSRGQAENPGDIAVQINRYKLTAREYENLYQDVNPGKDTPQARADFLNALIMRKLLLQEGQREGLDRQKDFLRSIESFWEQSLLKLVIDRKTSEVRGGLAVSDEELRSAYEKWSLANKDAPKTFGEMRSFLRWKIAAEKESAMLGSWTDELRAKADIKINGKAIGIDAK